MLSHGLIAKNIKGEIPDHYKAAYIAANDSGKVKIRDAVQKCYVALGYTEKEANKTISKWK